jgi:hypothetical protein
VGPAVLKGTSRFQVLLRLNTQISVFGLNGAIDSMISRSGLTVFIGSGSQNDPLGVIDALVLVSSFGSNAAFGKAVCSVTLLISVFIRAGLEPALSDLPRLVWHVAI